MGRFQFKYKMLNICFNPGGVEITLDAEKMGELIKLDPQLVLTDCKAEGLLDQFN